MTRVVFFLLTVGIFFQLAFAEGEVSTFLIEPKDSKRNNREVPLKVYHVKNGETQPVVIFSHGLGGSRNGNPYLGNHWAKQGYTCVFVQHIGSDESVWKETPLAQRFSALKSAASLQSMLDRFDDIPFVIDQLEKWNRESEHPLYQKLNLEKIGLSGHSFGAVTTMGLAGRKFRGSRTFEDKRIKAFVAMSPQPGKGLSPSNSFRNIQLPVFCMTGTEDGSPIDPSLSPAMRKQVYQGLPEGDKYQLVFEGAEHSAFSDGRRQSSKRNPKHHPTILKTSTQFWNAYLKDDEKAKSWLQSNQVREACELDSKDEWEWK